MHNVYAIYIVGAYIMYILFGIIYLFLFFENTKNLIYHIFVVRYRIYYNIFMHCYNTRIKNNCNLIVPRNHTNFGTLSPIIKGCSFSS